MTNKRNKIKSKPTQNSNKVDTNKPKRHLKTSNKTKNKTLKMVQININGIQNSLIELHQQLIEQSIDIALIQETKLHPETPDPNIPDYTAYRQDRPIKPKTEEEAKEENSSKNQATKSKTKHKSNINGGGLITYVKNDIPSTTIPPPNLPSTSNIESQSINISITKNEKLTLTNLYIPPRNSTISQQTEDKNITTLFNQLTNIKNSLIVGDVNAHSSLWHSPIADHRGEIIQNLLQNSDHTILNKNEPTRSSTNQAQQPTSPDITAITSKLLDKTNWQISKTPLRSDHLPIIITIKTKSNFRLLPNIKTFTNYKKAKWDEFTQEIENALQNTPPPTNVHMANTLLTNQILLADKHHIPKGRFKKVNQPLPQHIIDIIKQRNALRNSNHLDPNIKTLNDKITKLISEHKTELWKTKLEQIGTHNKNSHTLWKTINKLKNKSPQAAPNINIKFDNNQEAITQQDKAKQFNKQFVNVVKHTTKKSNRQIDKTTKALTTTPMQITNIQTYEAIKNTINKDSTGPDNLNIRHLKHLGPTAIQYLTDTLNLALSTNCIPQIWKLAKIIPIPKPNKDPTLGTSYRPISLLSPIAKTMEKVLLPHITSNITPVSHQHGFKTQHSTSTALHHLTNQITTGFNQKQPADRTIVVSLDLSKAFDTVNIHNLIQKLQQTNVTNLIKEICSKLHKRKERLHTLPRRTI